MDHWQRVVAVDEQTLPDLKVTVKRSSGDVLSHVSSNTASSACMSGHPPLRHLHWCHWLLRCCWERLLGPSPLHFVASHPLPACLSRQPALAHACQQPSTSYTTWVCMIVYSAAGTYRPSKSLLCMKQTETLILTTASHLQECVQLGGTVSRSPMTISRSQMGIIKSQMTGMHHTSD